jgi:hypothetical protein
VFDGLMTRSSASTFSTSGMLSSITRFDDGSIALSIRYITAKIGSPAPDATIAIANDLQRNSSTDPCPCNILHSFTCEISIEVLSQQVKSCGRHHRKLHKQIVYVEVDERTACEGIELPDDPTPFFDVFAEPSFWKTHHKNNFLGLKKAK